MVKTVEEACNLACDYCYYSRCGGLVKDLSTIDVDLVDVIIKKTISEGYNIINFVWQGGEPLLAGLDFFERVMASQKKYSKQGITFTNALQTNGTLITKRWAIFFKKYGVIVGVSLDGTEEINDKRRVDAAGRGSYNRVMKGINYLREEGVAFNVLTVVNQENVDRADDLMTFFEEQSFGFIQFLPCMDFSSHDASQPGVYEITPKQYGDFLCDLFDHWFNEGHPNTSIRFFENMLAFYLNRQPTVCIQLDKCPLNLLIEPNGDVYPCDFYIDEEYRMGNMLEDCFTDIIQHDHYKKFQQLKPALSDACQSCEYQGLCNGGCPRNRVLGSSKDKSQDYFCESYKQVYKYADQRMRVVAENIKIVWWKDYLARGNNLPNRNDQCICGSGKKYKKCCMDMVASETEKIGLK